MGQSSVSFCIYQHGSGPGGMGLVFTTRGQKPLVVALSSRVNDHPGLVCPLVPAAEWSHQLASNGCIQNPRTWDGQRRISFRLDSCEGE